MCIGEGKIFIVILFVYFCGLIGKGVYVIIVNDYFVKCDVEINCLLFEFLGLIVGCNVLGMML